MNILILHQPFPMGNYKLHLNLANRLQAEGHSVHTLQQFNAAEIPDHYISEYVELLNAKNYDAIYYEMLDLATFELVKNLNCKNRILCIATGGVWGFDNYEDKYGIYYDKIYTNDRIVYNNCKGKIPVDLFHYYFNCISESELVFKPEYFHSLVFVGMGFNRLHDEQYANEREIFFNNPNLDLTIYGNGWEEHEQWRKVLPENDLGSVYYSSDAAVAIIAGGQRSRGMINNRYSEIMYCECPILTIKYPTVDWYGAEEFLTFVDSPESAIQKLNDHDAQNTDKAKQFIINKDLEFMQKLQELIKL